MPIYVDCQYGHMIDIDFKRKYNEDGTHHIDIGASIDIKIYTKWLADQRQAQWNNVAALIDEITEIRAWYWESFMLCVPKGTNPDKATLKAACVEYVTGYAAPLGLSISED